MRFFSLTAAVLIAFGAQGGVACGSAEWGDLVGRFVYTGKVGKPAALKIDKDIEYCGKFPDETVDQSLIVGKDGGLANVLVSLRVARNTKVEVHPDVLAQAKEKPAFLDNVHCMFSPHLLGVWAGQQKFVVKNGDPIGQAVKIDSIANPPVNQMLAVGATLEHQFEKEEPAPLAITCGIHPWEKSFLAIQPSPYFAGSDESGKFVIKNLPVGTHEFQAWHELSGYLKANPKWKRGGRFKMTIKPGKNDLGTIKVEPKLLKQK